MSLRRCSRPRQALRKKSPPMPTTTTAVISASVNSRALRGSANSQGIALRMGASVRVMNQRSNGSLEWCPPINGIESTIAAEAKPSDTTALSVAWRESAFSSLSRSRCSSSGETSFGFARAS